MKKGIHIDYMPQNTALVFEKLSKMTFIKSYTLVGGTALSVQIKHRLSEDLDFIYDGEELNIYNIKRNIEKNFPDNRIIRIDGKYQIDYLIEGTKVTFFSTAAITVPFGVKEYSFRFDNINIATVDIIAVLKLGAIAQRNTIRDYYDIYYISKNIIPLSKIFFECKRLLPGLSPVTYSETLVYTEDILEDDVSNHLQPIINVTKQQMSEFFAGELRKIREDI